MANDQHRLRPYIQLGGFAFHGPLLWLASNTRNQPSYTDTAVVTVIVAGIGVALYHVLAMRVGRSRSLGLVSVSLFLFWNWNSLLLPIGPFPVFMTGLVVSILALTMAWMHAERWLFRSTLLSTAVVLTIVGTVLILSKTIPDQPSSITLSPDNSVVTLDRRPDIYIVVLDAYARGDVLNELFEFDNSPFETFLANKGFHVASGSTSNYSITHFSLASMLSMDYLMEPGIPVTPEDLEVIRTILSGENSFERLLTNEGYKSVTGSSAWWGTECTANEHCLENPLLSRTAHELIEGTPVGSLTYPSEGDVGIALTMQRLGQFREWEPEKLRSNGSPLYVFIHLPIPHPPLHAGPECEGRPDSARAGRTLNGNPSYEGEALSRRLEAYVDQVECANLIIRTLIERASPDSVFVVVSDHGSDSQGQVVTDPALLDDTAIWERLSNLTAVRLPTDCDGAITPSVSLVNLLGIVSNCVFGTSVELLPDRHFFAPSTSFALPVVEVTYSSYPLLPLP